MGPPKIDKAAYNEGRKFFEGGESIKNMIERVRSEFETNERLPADKADDRDVKTFSQVVGFADALLEMLRKKK